VTYALTATLLGLVTVGWFLVALLPALREHFGRTDITPLRLTSDAANIRFFAASFHRYVQEQLPALRLKAAGQPTVVTTLTDKTGAWYARPSDGIVTLFERAGASTATAALAAISEASLRVPSDVAVLRELYTSGSLQGGARNVYRAVLVDDDASLGDETTIVRWLDAGGSLRVGRNSTLWGRASSWGTMSLGDGTRFQRLAAPRIEFGDSATSPVVTQSVVAEHRVVPPAHAAVGSGRWKLDGDFTVPDGGVVDSDIVLSGTLTVGRGAKLLGAIRGGVVIAGDDCVFSRSIVATERLVVGARCRITGPVVVEGEAVLGDRCLIGEPGDETTISALFVRMGCGAMLCGEVWARRQGIVAVPEPADRPDSDLLPAADERAASW
jgi:hypothetical protein